MCAHAAGRLPARCHRGLGENRRRAVGMSPFDVCVWGNERRLGQRRRLRGVSWQFDRDGQNADRRRRQRFRLFRLCPQGRGRRRAAHRARLARARVVRTRARGLGRAAASIAPGALARLHASQRRKRRQHAHPQRQHPQDPSAQRTAGHSKAYDTLNKIPLARNAGKGGTRAHCRAPLLTSSLGGAARPDPPARRQHARRLRNTLHLYAVIAQRTRSTVAIGVAVPCPVVVIVA
jgi:hypothetical protein